MITPLLKKAQEDIGTTRNAKMVVPMVTYEASEIRVDGIEARPSTDKMLGYKVR